MISILKSVGDLSRLDELEKRESLSRAIRDCYSLAIHSTAHYAVEIDLALAVELRKNLKDIEVRSRAAASVEELRAAQSSFRGELREYRDKSAEKLAKMRKEVENATAAMTVFAETVASNGDDHEQEVSSQLHTLESATRGTSLEQIRNGVGIAVSGIQTSVHRIQRENQLVIAQLQDEIRVLHVQMEEERKALYTDRASGAWNRQKIDIHLDNLLRQNQSFCLLLVRVRNLKRIESQHSRNVVESVLKSLITRFSILTGEEAVIGRWTEDQFVTVLEVPPGRAMALSGEASRKLSGNYAAQENGLSHTVAVQATAGVVDRAEETDSSIFHERLNKLSAAISGA